MFLEDQNSNISKKELREMFLDVMMEFESKKEKEKEMYEKINEIHDFLKERGDINNNKHENNGDSQWTKNVKFSISQIADFLEITPDTVRKILKRFNLKFEYVKGKIVFSHEVAEKLIEYQNNKRKNRIKSFKNCPI
jgi:hypothetical protein